MEKFKFRACGPGIDGIQQVVSMNFEEETVAIRNESGQLQTFKVSEITLIPFIGLKDCHGIDIYFGDAVVCDLNWRGGRVGKEAFEVEYESGCFFLHEWTTFDIVRAFEENEWRSLEVIGSTLIQPNLIDDWERLKRSFQ